MDLAAQQKSIDATKRLLQLCGDLGLFVAGAVKRGWRTSDMFLLVQLVGNIISVLSSSKDLLPELKDLDAKEAGQLTELCYKIAKDIYDVLVK